MSSHKIEVSNNWIWSKAWEVPGESLLSGLLKLSWSNSVQTRELSHRLFDASLSKSQNLEVHPRSLLETSWTELMSPKHSPEWIQKLVQNTNSYSSQTLKCLCTDRTIRYCKECLAHGIHFLEFQIVSLQQCPLHRLPLLDICQSCKRPTSRYALCEDTFESPFNCCHCGVVYSSEILASNFTISTSEKGEIHAAMKPIANWLEHISSGNMRWMEKEACLITHLDESPAESRNLMFSRAMQSVFPVTSEISVILKNLSSWQSWMVLVHPQSKTHWYDLMDVEVLDQRKKIYKSIKRHLYKKHVRLHKSCMKNSSQGGQFGYLNSFRLPNAKCCVWAQTWMFWRSRFEEMHLANDLWKGPQFFADASCETKGGIDDSKISDKEWAVKVLLIFHGAFRFIRSWISSRWRLTSLTMSGGRPIEFEIVPPPYLQLMIATQKNIEVHFARIIKHADSKDSPSYRLLVGADESNEFKILRCVCNPFFPRNT